MQTPPSPSVDAAPSAPTDWARVAIDVVATAYLLFLAWKVLIPESVKIDIKAQWIGATKYSSQRPRAASPDSGMRFNLFEVERASKEEIAAEVARLARAS